VFWERSFDRFAQLDDDFRGHGNPVRTAGGRLQAFQFAILAPLVDGANADVEQSGRRFGRVAPIAVRAILHGIGHFGTTGRDIIFQSHPTHADPIEFPTGSSGQSCRIEPCGDLAVGLMGGECANASNDFVWSAPDFINPLATRDGMFTHGTGLPAHADMDIGFSAGSAMIPPTITGQTSFVEDSFTRYRSHF